MSGTGSAAADVTGYTPAMSVAARQPVDLWAVIRRSSTVDPTDLLAAVEAECREPEHDFRTRLLIRDSLRALAGYWGEPALRAKLSPLVWSTRDRTERDGLGEDRGFPTLMRRIMDRTKPEDVLDFLRELGRVARQPCRIDVGGSIALILRDLIARHTDDVDAVDEVPATIRNQHDQVNRLADRYGLRLTHFQSHYLPDGWARRVASFGVFGQLTVFLVDPVDVAVGKLFSRRDKDLDDVRHLRPHLDWPTVVSRLRSSTNSLRADARSLEAAGHNWYVLTGEEQLPPGNAEC